MWLSGDGRCDSPGHNTKYGTYTMLDQSSDKIVDFQIVQLSEVTSSNAIMLWREKGLKGAWKISRVKGLK